MRQFVYALLVPYYTSLPSYRLLLYTYPCYSRSSCYSNILVYISYINSLYYKRYCLIA